MSKVAIFLFLQSLSASVIAESAPDAPSLKLSRKYSLSQIPRHHPSYLYPTRSNQQKEQYHLYTQQSGDSSTFPANNFHDLGSNSFGYSTIGQENWNPSVWNNSHVRYQAGHHREPIEGNHFNYKYQHVQHPQQGHPIYKKPYYYYYGKGKFFKAPEKLKQKKAQYTYYGRPNGFKKSPYQRVYTPNPMHTYPMKNHGYQHYRRHYQTHFIPASDVLRTNAKKNFYARGEELSTTSPTSTTDRISREHPITSEAANYNRTYSFGSGIDTDYYMEQAKAEPGSFQESATRVYYGDRIYPSNKVSYQNAGRGLGHRTSYLAKSKPEEKEDDTVSHR